MKVKLSDTEAPACDHSHTLIRDTLLRHAGERGRIDPKACDALFELVETGRAVRRHLLVGIAAFGLSEAKFCALTVLRRLDPETITAADLAYHVAVSRSAVTDIVDQMVAEAWVQRERASDDRRTVRIGLTPRGRDLAAQAMDAVIATAAKLVANTSEPATLSWSEFLRVVGERLFQVAPPAEPSTD